MASSNSTHEPSAPVVSIDRASVRFKEALALYVQRLRVCSGERVFVLGRSGSGKTTLSRLIKGRLRATEGSVRVLDHDPSSFSRHAHRKEFQHRVAMIDQEFYLVPRMNVIRNVLCGALGRLGTWKSVMGVFSTDEWEKAEGILREVEMEAFAERRIETLSGGQRQRVAIARALMQDADLILADEPVSNLDPELAEDSLELLVSVTDRRGLTLMVNLHQPRLAKRFASRVIGLHRGHIVFDGDPDGLSTESEELIYTGPEPAMEPGNDENASYDNAAATIA